MLCGCEKTTMKTIAALGFEERKKHDGAPLVRFCWLKFFQKKKFSKTFHVFIFLHNGGMFSIEKNRAKLTADVFGRKSSLVGGFLPIAKSLVGI